MNQKERDQLDADILKAVKEGKNRFFRISSTLPGVPERVIDRRLQALRRQGVIAYNSKAGWSANGGPDATGQ